ncbi:MAG: preprotein translocase subunit SecE [Phycisphaerae bacterium]|nr:preprotein translocase subunit SecE [Phycisphaerae bacterium]
MASGIYKSGQGYYTRMGTTIGAGLLSLLGLWWLWKYAIQIQIEGVNENYVAAGICLLVGGVITGFLYYFVFSKPSTGDFLIATEGEMKKVNWSTRREIFGSTGVVIGVMLVMTCFIYVVDLIFVQLFTYIGVLETGM